MMDNITPTFTKNVSEFTKTLIKKHEGFRSKPYRDSMGILTIGWGRNLESKGISIQEATEMLENDLIDAEVSLVNIFGIDIFSIGEKRIAALLDMIFNLGEAGLRKFVKMVQAVKDRDWEEVAKQAEDSAWFRQVGGRSREDIRLLTEGNNIKPEKEVKQDEK